MNRGVVIVLAIIAVMYYWSTTASYDGRPKRCDDFGLCAQCYLPAATVRAQQHRDCCFCCDVACIPQWEFTKRCTWGGWSKYRVGVTVAQCDILENTGNLNYHRYSWGDDERGGKEVK